MAKKKINKKEKTIYNSIIKWLWVSMVVGIIAIASIFVLISFSMIPDTEELENPLFEISSVVLDDPSDGKTEQIGRYFKYDRTWLTFEQINPHITNALIATEDERFYDHIGIDYYGTARAVAYFSKRGGASTITQQLAKQFFTNYNRNFAKRLWQKLKEWVIAIEFEKRYTKEEIAAMYLNKCDFLYGANGIGSAARTYFGKDQQDLDLSESAILVGMLKNPDYFNVKKRPEKAKRRRNIVLGQLLRNGYITEDLYKETKAKEIDNSNFKRAKNYGGPAPYFRAELTKWLNNLLADDKYAKPDGSKYNIYTDGLIIHTTIDLNMQKHAEAAAQDHMKTLQDRYFNRWKNKDPWTYGADEQEKKIRKGHLNREVEKSERYQKIKSRILGSLLTQIEEQYPDLKLRNVDMVRMLQEEKNPGHLASIVKKRWATKNMTKAYKSFMKSELWAPFKENWKSFKSEVTSSFKKPLRMKVFDYNPKGYKEMTMTPMDSIRYHQQHMQFGSLSINPKNGFIRTWVGGINHDWFKYDHIQQSNNQIGSTFKPFIYAAAIKEKAYSPCQKVRDMQYSIPARDPNFGLDKTWSPSNSKAFSGEYVTLKEGLKQSMNSVSVYLMKDIGNVEVIRNLVENFGINKDKIAPYPSIALGTPDLTVFDMAGAYTVFANNGIFTKPVFVTKITDKNGRLIYSYQPEQRKVLSPEINYVMVDMLKYVMSNHSYKFKSEVAGKTGTTNDHVDGWFIGFTPELITATWVGGSHRWIRFLSLGDGQGGVMARPYFDKFMKRVESDPNIDFNTEARFSTPEGDLIQVDCDIYDQLADNLRKQDEELIQQQEIDEEFDDEF